MDQTVKKARTFLTEKTGVSPVTISAKGQGFSFTLEDVDRGAMDLFGKELEYPQEQKYCLLETTNEDDVGQYQETMCYDMPPLNGEGFHAEVHYSRSLTGNDPHERYKADINGMLWLTTPANHELLRQECDDSYYLRTVGYVVDEVRNMEGLLSTTTYYSARTSPKAHAKGRNSLIEAIGRLNRKIISRNL